MRGALHRIASSCNAGLSFLFILLSFSMHLEEEEEEEEFEGGGAGAGGLWAVSCGGGERLKLNGEMDKKKDRVMIAGSRVAGTSRASEGDRIIIRGPIPPRSGHHAPFQDVQSPLLLLLLLHARIQAKELERTFCCHRVCMSI